MFTILLALAWAGPADEAIDALVEGREQQALKVLRGALKDDPDGQMRCLLGQVAIQSGHPREALQVLDDLPAEATCAGRGAFLQAEALRALGRIDEAAARYGTLTQSLMNPTVQPLAQQLETWAERLVAEKQPTQAVDLLIAAGELERDPGRRLAFARRIAALGPHPSQRSFAVTELTAAITRDDTPEDRRWLAPLLDGRAGRALLAPLPNDAATQQARLGLAPDLAARQVLATAIVDEHGGSETARIVRLQVGIELAEAGWVLEARALLEGLEDPKADWALASLAVRTGATDAVSRLQALLKAHPTASFRADAEAQLVALELDALRSASTFDAARWDAVSTTPALALEAAWASGSPKDRLDELIARYPLSSEARDALEARAREEGLDWLRDHPSPRASEALFELEQPTIGIQTKGAGTPEVEVFVRGVERLELRLHRIDLEGWLRAGGMPDSLGELDVAIVAPDLTWTVPVPAGSIEQTLKVAVPVPGPGLYAVTAATTDREARTLLVVGHTQLLARAQGEDLALVALADGKPIPGARFLVRSGDTLEEVRADATGLARARLRPDGSAVVVADTKGGPALLQVGDSYVVETQPIQTAVDLDRPVYQPGDVVRFRALATRGGEPVRGPWRISLVDDEVTHQEVRLLSTKSGTIEGEVVLPLVPVPRTNSGSEARTYELRALPPGTDEPIALGTVRVIDTVPLAHDLRFLPGDGELGIEVRDGQDVPAQGVPLKLPDGLQSTDARGRVSIDEPPAGLPWSLSVQIAGRADSVVYSRPLPHEDPLRLLLPDARATPREPIDLELDGTGPALLRVVRLQDPRVRPAPRTAPPRFEPPALDVFHTLTAPPSPAGLRLTERELRVQAGEPLSLEGLPAGSYALEVLRPDGSGPSISVPLEVREGLRVRVDEAPVVGNDAEVRVDGGWALLTAEGGRMLDAVLVPPGKSRSLPVDRRWHGEVDLVASSITDQHARQVTVDASLQVSLEAAIRDGRWQVTGQVTDRAGHPQRAQVVIRAVDTELIEEVGAPSTLSPELLASAVQWSADAAVALGLSHGGWAVPLAAELMAEVSRGEEARRAKLAREGRLSESRVAGVLSAGAPLELGVGGLGMRGSGSGGGGYGSGSGSIGRGRHGTTVGREGLALRGARESGLWRVVDTDASGRWSIDASAPNARATWRVEAIAVAAGSLGRAEREVEPSNEPWLAVDPLLPGWTGDKAVARVRVVNPGPARQAQLRVDGVARSIELRAGEVSTASVSLDAGSAVELVLGEHSETLAFPLARPERIQAAPGVLPETLALTLDPGTQWDVRRAAVAGRSAIAVWPALDADGRRQAEIIIRSTLGAVRQPTYSQEPRAAAQALLLVAEAAQLLELPREIVEQAAEQLTAEPEQPQERLELTWARAVAGLPPVEATLGRLQRDREHLDLEGQALLDRLLIRLGRKPLGTAATGGPQAVLAAREAGSRSNSPVSTPLPLPTDPSRADWLRAALPTLAQLTSIPAVAELPPDERYARASRWPAGFDGRPAAGFARGVTNDDLCGTEGTPCQVARGEALMLTHQPTEPWEPSGGMRWSVDRTSLIAATEGSFVLRGAGGPLHVQVGEANTPLGESALLALASLRQQVGEPSVALLNARPSLEDWIPGNRGRAAQLRFAETEPTEAAAWVAAFEDLKDEVPHQVITLADVVHTAAAYHQTGRHDRAIEVYERAIGQLFLQEAEVASRIDSAVGTLATIEALRRIADRYPAVPLVEQATFALPDRLLSLVGSIPTQAAARGVTDTELRLMAAAWDRDFVALSPKSPHTPEAGLRLATGLLQLDAEQRALDWSKRLLQRHPEHAMVDRWMLLEALIATELGENKRAQAVLQQLATAELPLGGGRLGPSALREDARFALGRLAEVERRWGEAATWYREVAGGFPEAALASEALQRVTLTTDAPLVQTPLWERSKVVVQATNVRDVEVRAYAVDLRTLFLRESGLPRPEDVQIDGLRPALNLSRSVEAGPFPVERVLDLPLDGAGAWLVRLDTDAASAAVWVLRSDLELDAVDAHGIRRLVSRLEGEPIAEVEVRAVGNQGIVAEQSDVRGVTLLGMGSPALAQHGLHYALTADAAPQPRVIPKSHPSPMPRNPSLLDRVRSREEERRSKNRSTYDYIGNEAAEMPASAL